MSKKSRSTDQKEMSFIEKARRAQIVECAIETIAQVGYAQASLGEIIFDISTRKQGVT